MILGLLVHCLPFTLPHNWYHSGRGALLENYIINEIIKLRFNKGLRRNLFYWRDVSGHEIDIIVDHGSTSIAIELKSGMTIVPDFFKELTFRHELTKNRKSYIIYGGMKFKKKQ